LSLLLLEFVSEYREFWFLKASDLLWLFKTLQFLVTKSIPTGAQYVTLHIKIRWRKANICRRVSGNWFFPCIFAQLAEAGKKHSKVVHLLEKSVINMIWLLLPAFDWPIIMIGPRGSLLLVVPTYLFYGWGCKKVNN
jgi:hypothetical protein